MARKFKIEIVTPEKLVFSEEIESLVIPAERGYLGVLAGHAPLLATLQPGEITIKGISRPATLTGTIAGPAVDHFGATRVGLKLDTVVDRTDFDMKWNMPLPNGEPALSNDVVLSADLQLSRQA